MEKPLVGRVAVVAGATGEVLGEGGCTDWSRPTRANRDMAARVEAVVGVQQSDYDPRAS